MTLNDLSIGQEAIIIDVDDIDDHLYCFGFIPNSKVKVLRIAPFGCPKLINIKGSNVAVRINNLKKIIIQKIS